MPRFRCANYISDTQKLYGKDSLEAIFSHFTVSLLAGMASLICLIILRKLTITNQCALNTLAPLRVGVVTFYTSFLYAT